MMIELVLLASFVTAVLYVYNEFRAFYYIKPPTIHCKQTHIFNYLLDNCKALKKPFVPTFWAFNSHMQTWLKILVRFQDQPKLTYTREYLEMEDKGIISLDWAITEERKKPTRKKSVRQKMRNQEKPILLIFPSALHTRVEDYAYLCAQALRSGFKPLFFNRRGYSQTPLTTPKVSTYCDKSDLVETLDYLNNQFPFSEIYAVAYSMETGNLISYLGQEGEHSVISAAVCVSATFGCENFLNDHAIKQPYNFIITEKMKTMFQREHILDSVSTPEEIENCHNLVDLQDQVHVRSNKYETLKDYLQYNNPLSHLNRIKVPILFIHAKDDPVVPDVSVPAQYFNISETSLLVTTEYGGHCGFFEDTKLNSWADNLSVDFLELITKSRSQMMPRNGERSHRGFPDVTARNRSKTVL